MTDIIEAPRERLDGFEYPTSDGKPMAETDLHRDVAVYVIEALKLFFGKRPDVYVSGNNFVYYLEGEQLRCISPDAYVVFGVLKHSRDCYVAHEEGGRFPNVVFEFTSKSTRREDERVKKPRYERELRVPEYFRFDPTGDYLSPRLQGFRLIRDRYVPLELVDGRLRSEELGLELVQQDEQLRLFNPMTREWLPTTEELDAARQAADQARREETARRVAAEEAAAEEAARRVAVEEDNARLRAELEELRRQRS